jgi:hypothetical protein
VVLVAGTAAWLNWYALGLGVWLIAVAACSGFAGPAGVWAVDALAVGIPFLLMAAIRIGRSKLEDARYVQMEKTGSGVNALTAAALTHDGRAALGRYTAALRQLLDTAESVQRR